MKDSYLEAVLPCFNLPDRIAYMPGVTYRTVLATDQGMDILSRFASVEGLLSEPLAKAVFKHFGEDKSDLPAHVSPNALDGVHAVGNLKKNTKGSPILACIPGIDFKKANVAVVATICQLTDVEINDKRMIIGLRSLYRARIESNATDNEVLCTIKAGPDERDDNAVKLSYKLVPEVVRLYSNVDRFLRSYVEDSQDQEKDLFLRLSPLATLLYAQLSEAENNVGLRRLIKYYRGINKTDKRSESDYERLLGFNDILMALFPFTVKQRADYLGQLDPYERLYKLEECLAFANDIFEHYLDMDYVLELWKTMEYQTGDARLMRARFISGYVRTLRALVEQVGTPPANQNPQRRAAGALGMGPQEDEDEDEDPELERVRKFVESIGEYRISEDGKRLITGDFKRMDRMNKSSSDYQVLRTYMDVITDIPWVKTSEYVDMITLDVNTQNAKQKLDYDHYGMESVKERILEYLAVLKLEARIRRHSANETNPESSSDVEEESHPAQEDSPAEASEASKVVDSHVSKAPILLLTGPPGVGKTSLARSVASTLGRKFQRISLGGLNDFADLKGHRRTYVGAIPGLIVQALRRAQSSNPVILLDEIDKVSGASHAGNPEAALLEILDPEQNMNFQDHYIGFPIDLSQILFICTSNDQWEISPPLRDRMEVIELAGYSYYEKVKICKKYVIPRQIERNALPDNAVNLDDDTILKIATEYTRESGIRNLERLVASICRSKAIEYTALTDDDSNSLPAGYVPHVTTTDLPKYIGIADHLSDNDTFGKQVSEVQELYGIANGLSYNSDGSGSLLKFEMVGLPGSRSLSCTGSLGEVLLESAEIANTLVGYMLNKGIIRCPGSGLDSDAINERYNNTEIHLHVPEGAVSKDGPSAGITMTTCILSLILQQPVPSDLAMTGEITLTGKVLPIGGLKEKLLGAHLTRRIKRVLVPRLNRKSIIEDYVANFEDREKAHELLSVLTEDEETMLQTRVRSPFKAPEEWILSKLGIRMTYVEDFADVVDGVWQGRVTARPKVLIQERSHL